MTSESDPFAQLLRCHRRLEEACDALTVAAENRDPGTITEVSAFFGRQIRRHETDEESSLFPRLAAADRGSQELLDRLASEHRDQNALAARLAELALRAEAEKDAGDDDELWRELVKVVDPLVRSYRAHIEAEEQRLFPAAQRLLGAAELSAIVREMNERRGR
jgi:hemerythrin-like domain-containing protein